MVKSGSRCHVFFPIVVAGKQACTFDKEVVCSGPRGLACCVNAAAGQPLDPRA